MLVTSVAVRAGNGRNEIASTTIVAMKTMSKELRKRRGAFRV